MVVLKQFGRDLWSISLVLTISLALVGSDAGAQTIVIPREHHAWGRFMPGAWTKVRKWMEELDEKGNVKSASTTETKTTLVGVDETGCTLQLEVTVEVAGKRFVAQPRQVRVEFDGGNASNRAGLRKVGEKAWDLGGKPIKCATLEATVTSDDTRVASRLEYCDSVPPFVLRRETVTTNADGKQVLEQTTMEVIAVEMPQKVLTELKSGAHIRTVQKQKNGSTFTLEVVCLEVPGGVVSHTSKDSDAAGKLVRRSTLELLDYGVAGPAETAPRSGGVFRHSRVRRSGADASLNATGGGLVQQPRGVVAVIRRGERLLVIRRSQHVRAPGTYCFPGGAIEEGETEPDALRREMQEELGCDVTPIRRIWRNCTAWQVDLAWWLAELDADAELRPNLAEVEFCQWLTVAELRELPSFYRATGNSWIVGRRG